MKNSSSSRYITFRHHSGFTLVEMLVSVALVLLMMSMFATVFVSATTTLSTQRGIAENDQRGRMLSTVIRGDLAGRTFLNVQPYRAGDAADPSGYRNGYFEIDEGDPNDDTDDVLQFTATVSGNTNGTRYTGLANNLTTQPINSYASASAITVSGDFTALIGTGTVHVWISGSAGINAGVPYSNDGRYLITSTPTFSSGLTTIPLSTSVGVPASLTVPASAPYGSVLISDRDPEFDDGVVGNGFAASSYAEVCYFLRNGSLYRRVLLIRDTQSGGNQQPQWPSNTPITPLSATTSTFWRDYDYSAFFMPVVAGTTSTPGPIGSQTAIYTPPAVSLTTLNPLSPSNTVATSGQVTSLGASSTIFFHDVSDSIKNPTNNSYVPLLANLAATPSIALPYQRFGHSVSNGLPLDASARAVLPGPDATFQTADDVVVSIGRFTTQECSSSTPSPTFGYPALIPVDPVNSANGNVSPFDRRNIEVNPNTGQVLEYTNSAPINTPPYVNTATNVPQNNRRGQDILMANVLSFDVKVWDPINGAYVDMGDTKFPGGPFSVMPFSGTCTSNGTTTTYTATAFPPSGSAVPLFSGVNTSTGTGAVISGYTDGVFYNINTSGNVQVIGGRLNSTYGSDPTTSPYGFANPNGTYGFTSSPDGRPHFRFDTWHPNACVTANSVAAGFSGTPNVTTGFYNQPPYFQPDDNTVNVNSYKTQSIPTAPSTGYFYNEPPYVPVGQLATTGQYQPFPLASIQITINYRDISSNQIRSMTIIQSLCEKLSTVTTFNSNNGAVTVPTP